MTLTLCCCTSHGPLGSRFVATFPHNSIHHVKIDFAPCDDFAAVKIDGFLSCRVAGLLLFPHLDFLSKMSHTSPATYLVWSVLLCAVRVQHTSWIMF